MILFSKKGTTMVEAAFIWPLAILSLVSVIYIIINIYCFAEKPARFHMQVNDMAGEYSETYSITPSAKGKFDIDRGIARINGECRLYYENGALLRKKKDILLDDSAYILREKRHMRMADNVGGE